MRGPGQEPYHGNYELQYYRCARRRGWGDHDLSLMEWTRNASSASATKAVLETLYGNLRKLRPRRWATGSTPGTPSPRCMEGAPLAFELRRDGRSIDPTGLMLPLTE